MVQITSKINSAYAAKTDSTFMWKIKNECPIQENDRAFIEAFNPTVYYNDLECYVWAFDEKLPSGAWLENIRFSGDMRTATAHIYAKEARTV